MAKVRAIRDCFVDSLRKVGEVFEYDGPKNHHLEPVKDSKKPEPAAPEE